MKHIRMTWIIGFLILFVSGTHAQNVDSPYQVGTWQGFRSAAVSFTFDDGCANQFAEVLPMFNEYGFKLTLFTVVSWAPDWSALQTAASQGHEIASHTVTHANLSTVSTADQIAELQNSRDAIDAHITGQKCLTVAYPYCVPDTSNVCSQFYLAARGCSGAIEPSTPANFMNISSFVCGSLSAIQTPQDFNAKAAEAAGSKGWVVFLLHGIDNDGGYSPTTSANLKGALDSMKAHTDTYWVAPFGTIARYIKERNAVRVKETSSTDSSITVRISESLDISVFNIPVTIRRPLPQGWESASVYRNGKPVAGRVIDVGNSKNVIFDVVPDSAEISIQKAEVTSTTGSLDVFPGKPELLQNYPNPFNPTTVVSGQLTADSWMRLVVFDNLGRQVAALADGRYPAGKFTFTFNGSGLASGVYFCRLTAGEYSAAKAMLLVR